MTTSYSLFPLGVNDAWLLPVLCLGAFFVIAMWGKYLPGKGSLVSIVGIGLGFVIFWFVLKEYVLSGAGIYGFTWFSIDGFHLNIAMNVDALTIIMLGLITSVATLIQIYSTGYMRGDPRFPWYFAAHSLFAAAMLGLVLAENFLILYVSWELVGLCSYLLIGYYYERRSAAEAAKKAFITTRIGDVGLLIGVLVLWKATGTFSIPDIMHKAAAGEIAGSTMTWSAILLFLGAMGKSAQFPFHVWLPDAMEGPTPVSALIHAATMVTAGVYLVARAFPLFEAAPGALELVMAVGIFTAFMAATMGLVMTDIKKVLAYSTISQLGFMMMSLGAFGYTAAIFHLIAHGFFKALLFLGAGSVIHSTENQEMDKLGGLWRKMPITTVTFGVATLAMAGIPPLSGFFSKDEILSSVYQHRSPAILVLALLVAFMSALYMVRLFVRTFLGKLSHENHHAHESPFVMTVPLMLLALVTLVFGFAATNWVGPLFHLPAEFKGLGTFLFLEEPEGFHVNVGLMMGATIIAALGVLSGLAIYVRRTPSAEAIVARIPLLYKLASAKYYMDDLYQAIINRVVLVLARFIATFDRVAINDGGVNGSGLLAVIAGDRIKYSETGRLYNYGLFMIAGIIVAVAIAAPILL